MSRLAEFKFARTRKRQFSQFLRSIIKCFHPNKKNFHQELFLFLKMEHHYILVLLLYEMQKAGCVCWFHGRYYSRRYSNFAKKGAELVYLYRNFWLKYQKLPLFWKARNYFSALPLTTSIYVRNEGLFVLRRSFQNFSKQIKLQIAKMVVFIMFWTMFLEKEVFSSNLQRIYYQTRK